MLTQYGTNTPYAEYHPLSETHGDRSSDIFGAMMLFSPLNQGWLYTPL